MLMPAMKNGLSPSKIYLPKNQGFATIFAYLCHQFPHVSADEWASRFRQGDVLDDAHRALAVTDAYRQGCTVFYYRDLPAEVVVPFEHQIIFENEHIMVVDKPHFLVVNPSGQYVQQSLLVRLKKQTGYQDLAAAHRLDRETAGLLLFTKTPKVRGLYQSLFAEQRIHKTYHAIAPIRPELSLPCHLSLRLERSSPFYTMQVASGPANSCTQIELLQSSVDGLFGKYRLTPTTGKLHQLRVHLNHLGIAIVNDSFYPKIHHRPADDFSSPLQLLAKKLSFNDPLTGESMVFESPRKLLYQDWFD